MFHKIFIRNKLDMMSEIPKCPLSVFPSFLLSMKKTMKIIVAVLMYGLAKEGCTSSASFFLIS